MIVGLFASFPGFSDPYQENFFNQSYSNFFGIFGLMFVFFILCTIIAKALSLGESDRVLKREPLDPTLKEVPETPVVRSYLPELMGKLKSIEGRIEKYTLQPKRAAIKKFFEPHEVAIPQNQSVEDRKRGWRNNVLKLCCLGSLWAVISIFFGIWGCILSYPLCIYTYSFWRVPVIAPIEKCTETTIVPVIQQYQPLDLNDLLYGWLSFQKRSFTGLFKQMPAPDDLHYSQYIKSTFVEIESDAEFFTIDHYQEELPYSQSAGQEFYAEPFPIKLPKKFEESSQEYACQGTLEKKKCEICGGKGAVRCTPCEGSGKVVCPSCDGKGYLVRHHTHYETHQSHRTSHTHSYRVACSCSNGLITCETCSGSGQVTCPTCDGEKSLGIFLIREYNFHHQSKVKTFKETQNQVSQETELIDVPNDEGRLISLDKGERFLGENPDKLPSISQETIQILKSAREEIERENNQLPNLIFDQYAYREFPELAVQFTYQEKNYMLKGRGFKPLQKKYFQADKYPISWQRVLLFGLPPLLWIILSFVI